VQITSDFICPWCWIGHQTLIAGMRKAGLAAEDLRLSFLPYELNPGMPLEGRSRRAYRTQKFGSWARSQAMDAEVTLAGRHVGADFQYQRVLLTPNTRLAHRLMFWAQASARGVDAGALAEAIFRAYFSQGLDIGDAGVLVGIAVAQGLDGRAVRHLLDGDCGESEVLALERKAQLQGIRGVPSYSVAGHALSGAQPVDAFARLLAAAARPVTA
jgi:predicted DsbA family dithiol-disulfide isomerase